LYLFGGDVLEGFAFALLVGIITSTYSTVFIASAVAVLLSGRKAAPTTGAVRPAAGKPSTKSSGRKAS
jgi:preprotein translocase subunit SecF